MKNILFYGDSNTWGYDPETGERYDYHERWTTICARELGEGYLCIPAGLNGRTTIFDDPWKGCRNGVAGLDYALQMNKPLDLCVIMMGTNDLKFTDAAGSAAGMEHLVHMALTANKRYAMSSPVFPEGSKILLVSPVLIRYDIDSAWDEASAGNASGDESRKQDLHGSCAKGVVESRKLAALYRNIAERTGIFFMDAAQTAVASPVDGIHLGREGHNALGLAMAERIPEILTGN